MKITKVLALAGAGFALLASSAFAEEVRGHLDPTDRHLIVVHADAVDSLILGAEPHKVVAVDSKMLVDPVEPSAVIAASGSPAAPWLTIDGTMEVALGLESTGTPMLLSPHEMQATVSDSESIWPDGKGLHMASALDGPDVHGVDVIFLSAATSPSGAWYIQPDGFSGEVLT